MKIFPKVFLMVWVCGLVMIVFSPKATAQKNEKPLGDLEESDELPSVQNRLYRVEHEFSLGVGVLPVDPFSKGVTFGGGYGWHFNDIWAVELQGAYLRNIKTDLREKLENGFAEPPERFPEILYFGGLGVLFKPIYGKLSFLNKTLIYGDIYLSMIGVVSRIVGNLDRGDALENRGERMAFGGAPGFGLRGYLNRYISLRFDFRSMVLYSAGKGYYPLSLTLSVAFSTRSDL